MISEENKVFRLTTAHTDYWFRVTGFGHPEHIYYGPRIRGERDIDALLLKRSAVIGSSIVYDESDELYCLDQMCLEWSGNGCGDYRYSPQELRMPDTGYVQDFVYHKHLIVDGCVKMETLPGAYGEESWSCQTLILTLKDRKLKVYLKLFFTVFEDTDVITRRAVLINKEEAPLCIRRLLSMMIDLPNRNFRMMTLEGGWAKEAHLCTHELSGGIHVNSSSTGSSSNRRNPAYLLAEEGAGQDSGYVYGFNLVYSGNHFSFTEVSAYGMVRTGIGIAPHCLDWELKCNDRFETPEACMTFSNKGFNGMSRQFAGFVREHIVRGAWKRRLRPVVFNSWEGYFFDFDERKLLRAAGECKRLGAELFVLDDGWFGERNSDRAGLGDYRVNTKKLPNGLSGLIQKIRGMGLGFGLWFEPEMVNEDSDLYRTHPEYVVRMPGRKPVKGRNQLVLDLCNPKVRDYIVENVSRILDENKITYVKWDMNRHIAEGYSPVLENQGEFYHRYVMGLYDVLGRIFGPRPRILVESCSSGGNRFDLGMLCYSQQIWASDNTDPVERLRIQEGLSYFYPLSAISAHVSQAPHQQTLRNTQLSTRFNVAAFGCLGYELELKYLTNKEREEIREQIAFYKENRKLFQYGIFSRVPSYKDNKVLWQCVEPSGNRAVSGFFQTLAQTSEGYDALCVTGLKEDTLYRVTTREQFLYIRRFGGLMKHVLPVALNPEGMVLRTANKYYTLKDCQETYLADGQMLQSGVLLNNQFMGSYYNNHTRLLGDYGSNLYLIEKVREENKKPAERE